MKAGGKLQGMDSSPSQVRRLRRQDQEGQGPPRVPSEQVAEPETARSVSVLRAGKGLFLHSGPAIPALALLLEMSRRSLGAKPKSRFYCWISFLIMAAVIS